MAVLERARALLLQFKDKTREKERQKRLAARALMPKASRLMPSPCVQCGAYSLEKATMAISPAAKG